MDISHFGAIILAAGKGKRMNLTEANKVTLSLHKKPIILHIVHFMHKLSISNVVVVVGYAKESVMDALKNEHVIFAEQTEQLGTGHAVIFALNKLTDDVKDVMVVYGDDAVLYAEKNLPAIKKLFEVHSASQPAFTFLTIEKKEPFGLGRIVRDKTGDVVSIVEEKDATEEQKRITEVNPGCFIFKVDFLKKYLHQVEKSPATGEYYLTSVIDLAIKNKEKIATVRGGGLAWRGVNTPEELEEAKLIYSSVQN